MSCGPHAAGLRDSLGQAESLVARVVHMGPLVSLLMAGEVRQKFLRVNRDLVQNFTVLGTGETLLVSRQFHTRGSGHVANVLIMDGSNLSSMNKIILAGIPLSLHHSPSTSSSSTSPSSSRILAPAAATAAIAAAAAGSPSTLR